MYYVYICTCVYPLFMFHASVGYDKTCRGFFFYVCACLPFTYLYLLVTFNYDETAIPSFLFNHLPGFRSTKRKHG